MAGFLIAADFSILMPAQLVSASDLRAGPRSAKLVVMKSLPGVLPEMALRLSTDPVRLPNAPLPTAMILVPLSLSALAEKIPFSTSANLVRLPGPEGPVPK